MVGIYKCEEYSKQELDTVVDKIFEEHNFNARISKGMNVVLKPNLLAKKKPADAVTTHPVFIAAVAKKVISLGAKCILADGPPGGYTKNTLESYYEYNELKQLSKLGVELNYDTSFEYVNIGGKLLTSCDIISPILNADLVINLPKVKTHSFMNMTCAVKNMFGILPGVRKAEMHSRFTEQPEFADVMIDISLAVKNQISIVDGIIALEGNGPGGGDPRKLGLILAGENQFELDYVVCKIIGMEVNDTYTVAQSIKRNLIEPSNISVVGEKIEDVSVSDFKFPDTMSKNKSKIAFRMAKYIRPYPVFNKEKCKLCRLCVDRCPEKVLTVKNNRVKLDKKNCIRCFCCHEHCPYKAIDIKHIINFNLK